MLLTSITGYYVVQQSKWMIIFLNFILHFYYIFIYLFCSVKLMFQIEYHKMKCKTIEYRKKKKKKATIEWCIMNLVNMNVERKYVKHFSQRLKKNNKFSNYTGSS